MARDEGKFTIIDKEGNRLECDILFTFESEETRKSYIVYTDNTKDSKGNTKVYASVYNSVSLGDSFAPIETEEEWQVIEDVIERIKKDVSVNGDEKDDKLKGDDLAEIQSWIDELPSIESEQPMDDSSFDRFLAKKREIIYDKKENKEYLEGVLDEISQRIIYEHELYRIDSLFELIGIVDDVSYDYYSNMAKSAYEKHNYPVAEIGFRKAIDASKDVESCLDSKNNLAYLIRRGEIRTPKERSIKEIVSLLREGVEKREPFSLINMALLWALEFGSDSDWKMADNLARLVDKKISSILIWWSDVAKEGEAEGYLVHLFMVRHGKIKNSLLGSIEELFNKVEKDYPGIPDDMRNIITPFEDDDFPPIDD